MVEQWHIIPIAAHNNNGVKLGGKLYGVHRQSNVPVPFFRSTGKYLQILCLDLKADFFQRVKKILLFLPISLYDIGNCPYQASSCSGSFEYLRKIDLCIVEV